MLKHPSHREGTPLDIVHHRTDCTLEIAGGHLRGTAHIIEINYREGLRFCNFVMQAMLDSFDGDPFAPIKPNQPAALVFENGRRALVGITTFSLQENYFDVAGAGVFS
jgi:hypothetical protein